MKKILLFLCPLFNVVLLHAQTTDEQAVQQTVVNTFNALSNKDSMALKNECAADVKFYEYGKIWTIDSLINRAITTNTATDFKRNNKIDFVSTTIAGNTAWVTYNLYSGITSNGNYIKIHWMETLVLVKEYEKWKIKLLHSTLIKRE